MDMLGYVSYTIPVFGEISDIIWAPVSGFIFFLAFKSWRGAVGGLFNFIEELLPGVDFIPSFTIMWCWQYFKKKKEMENIPRRALS